MWGQSKKAVLWQTGREPPPGLWSWTLSLHNCEKQISVDEAIRTMVFSYGSWAKTPTKRRCSNFICNLTKYTRKKILDTVAFFIQTLCSQSKLFHCLFNVLLQKAILWGLSTIKTITLGTYHLQILQRWKKTSFHIWYQTVVGSILPSATIQLTAIH